MKPSSSVVQARSALLTALLRRDDIWRRKTWGIAEALDMIVETADGSEEYQRPVQQRPWLNSSWIHQAKRYVCEDEQADRQKCRSVCHSRPCRLQSNCRRTAFGKRLQVQRAVHEHKLLRRCYGGMELRTSWRLMSGHIECILLGIVIFVNCRVD